MSFFFLFLLFTPFVPYFGTIDIIGSQWLYLSLLNFTFFIFNFSLLNYLHLFKKLFDNPFSKAYFIFFILSIFSVFFATNWTVSLVDISRIIITFVSVIHFSYFYKNTSLNFNMISALISIFLFFEIIYSLYPLIEFIIFEDIALLEFDNLPSALKGVSGNKNVLASDLVFKSLFLLYLIFYSDRFYRFFAIITFFLSSFLLIILSSRASYISFFLVLVIFAFHALYSKIKFKKVLYILIPFLLSYFSVKLLPNSSLDITNRLSSINTVDASTNQRLTLYDNAIDFIISNPFIGCGIGNWKIESLPYWKDKLTGYTIPYHAHNDFLEITTEIGLIGGFSYLFFFAFILFFSSRMYFKSLDVKYILLFCLCLVYFIDASFNFPFERALSQVNFIILFSFSIMFYNNSYDETPS